MLRRFLQQQEEARLSALRAETAEKDSLIRLQIQEMSDQMAALAHTIRDVEQEMRGQDVAFLKVSVEEFGLTWLWVTVKTTECLHFGTDGVKRTYEHTSTRRTLKEQKFTAASQEKPVQSIDQLHLIDPTHEEA